MSDILFNPNNTSSKIPRDVLNMIATYVAHPLSNVIKKEVQYEIDNTSGIIKFNTICFNNKRYSYQKFTLDPFIDIDWAIVKYEDIFDMDFNWFDESSPDDYINSKFKIYFSSMDENYHLTNSIPMHKDTFFITLRYLEGLGNYQYTNKK